MNTPTRKHPNDRRQEILETAISMTARGMWQCLTRDEIAARVGVSPALITHYFITMGELKDEVICEGCRRRIPQIVTLGLAMGHADAMALPPHVRATAAKGV